MRRAPVAALFGLALLSAPAPSSAAPSLALDTAFGSGGKLTFSAAPGSNDTKLYDTVAGSDGSLISVGAAYQDGPSSDGDLLIAKRKPDGSEEWTKTVPVNLVANGDDVLHRVVFSGGVITAVGDVKAATGRDLVVVQVDQQGNTTSFGGGDGVFTHSFGTFDSFRGGVRLSGGDFVVGGSTSSDAIAGNAVLALVKGDGTGLVNGFGTAGVVNTSLGATRIDQWEDLEADASNVIAAAGVSDRNSGSDDAMVGKFSGTNGNPMPFGVFTVPTLGMDGAHGIAQASDGAVVAAGERLDGGSLIPTLWAFTPDGGANMGFDGDGRLDVPFNAQNFGAFTDLQFASSGQIVPAGWAFQNASAGSADLAIAAVDPDGTVAAKTTHDVGGANDFMEAVALTDTSAVPAGSSFTGGKEQAAMAAISLADVAQPPADPPAGGASGPTQTSKNANLGIFKRAVDETGAEATAVGVGKTVLFEVTVFNSGPDEAENVRVTDTLPGAFDATGAFQAIPTEAPFPGIPLAEGNCDVKDSKTVSCTVPKLPAGRSVAFRIRVKALEAGFPRNVATVGSTTEDPVDNNEVVSEPLIVTADPHATAEELPDGAHGTTITFLDPQPQDARTAEVNRLTAAQAPPSIEALSRITRVEVAVLKKQRNRQRCLWLANKKLKFKASRSRNGKCDQGRWLKAKGTRRWRYKLARKWPKGTYTLYSRAVNRAGVRETRFSKKDKNMVTFRVRR